MRLMIAIIVTLVTLDQVWVQSSLQYESEYD